MNLNEPKLLSRFLSRLDNWRNNNPELPIVGTESNFMTASEFGEYTDLLTSFRENIQTPFESILLKIAEKISDEYEQSKRADQKNKWLRIFDPISTFQNLDINYNGTGINVLMSRLDTLMLATIGCTPGSFFEIKDDEDLVYNYNMAKSFVDDEIIERRLRSAKLDLALGRTSFPQPRGTISIKEYRDTMERLAILPKDLEGSTKQAVAKFATKYEVFKRNMPEKDIIKITPEISKRYERSGKVFVSTEDLLDIPTLQSKFSKDELKSFCERQLTLGTGENELTSLFSYRTTTTGIKTEYRRTLLTYDSMVWMNLRVPQVMDDIFLWILGNLWSHL